MEKLENNTLEVIFYMYAHLDQFPRMEEKVSFIKNYIINLPFHMKHYDTCYQKVRELFFLNHLLEIQPIFVVFTNFHILEEVLELSKKEEKVFKILEKNPQLEIIMRSLNNVLEQLVSIQCDFNLLRLLSFDPTTISFQDTTHFFRQDELPISVILGIEAFLSKPFQDNFLDEYFGLYDNMCKAKMDYYEDLKHTLQSMISNDSLDYLKRIKEFSKKARYQPWIGFHYYQNYLNSINSLLKRIPNQKRKREKKEKVGELFSYFT